MEPTVRTTKTPLNRTIFPIVTGVSPSGHARFDLSGDRLPAGADVDAEPRTPILTGSPHVVQTSRLAVDLFLVWLASAGLGRDTLRVRRRHLVDLASTVPDVERASTADLAEWLASHPWGHSARQQARATLRLFYAWLVDEGRLASSPATRLPRVRHPRPKSRPTPLPVIAAALLRAAPREQRMILVARYAGLRRSEVAQLHSGHLTTMPDGATRAIHVRGKGEHERLVPMHPTIADVVEGAEGYLFASDRHPAGHLDPDTVGRYVSALLGPGWSMHTLRHRAANDWLAVTNDLVAVQELLGHASLTTTRIYLDPRQDVMTQAVMGVA